MSIHSDVAIAIHKDLTISEKTTSWLKILADKVDESDEGTLYVLECVSWYKDTDPDIKHFFAEIGQCNAGKYLIVEACHEYPGSSDDIGEWTENPWNLSKYVKESLYYETYQQ